MDSYKKLAICRAIKRKKENEESRKRKIKAMNGACAAEKAPRGSVEAEKRKRYRKRKTEEDEDRGEENDKATKELKRPTTKAFMVPSKSAPPPCHNVSKKRVRSGAATLDPVEELRISTLNRQYPLLSAITARTSVSSGKGKDKNNGGVRLVTLSVDLTRCLLSEYNWALANRKNLTRSVNLWMSTHDRVADLINQNDYTSVNKIINKLGWDMIDDVLREKSYFELLADGCNALFGSDILHNKIFDPNFKTIDYEKLLRGDFRYIIRNLYQPMWWKLSPSINMISGGKGRGGESFIGKGNLATLQSCAAMVLERARQPKLNSIIQEATSKANCYSKFLKATRSKHQQHEQQQQQPQIHMTPHAMPYPQMQQPFFFPNHQAMLQQRQQEQQQQTPYASAIPASFSGAPSKMPANTSSRTTPQTSCIISNVPSNRASPAPPASAPPTSVAITAASTPPSPVGFLSLTPETVTEDLSVEQDSTILEVRRLPQVDNLYSITTDFEEELLTEDEATNGYIDDSISDMNNMMYSS